MAKGPVLVVDDNPVNLKLVSLTLRVDGFDVITAADADEARAAIRKTAPRVILMDIQLPGTDGLALTRELKASSATREIPVVALTAYAMKGDEEMAIAAGCDGYIAKPIDTKTLSGIVDRYLTRA